MTALKATEQASLLGTFVPPGVIMPFAGATAPSGWLICEGAPISRTTYAALYAAISVAWGYGDNSTTFNLPDLKGRFLRGRANTSGNDPDRSRRIACNTGGNTADNVGSVQGMATSKSIGTQGSTKVTGGVVDNGHQHGNVVCRYHASNGLGSYDDSNGSSYPKVVTSGTTDHPFIAGDGSASLSEDLETRPINANVNYIIKI